MYSVLTQQIVSFFDEENDQGPILKSLVIHYDLVKLTSIPYIRF